MYENEIALMFKRMRDVYGLSKNEMTNLLMVDRHTYNKIEKGLTTPYLSNFTALLSELGSNAFILYMGVIYPEYRRADASSDERREAIVHYVRNIASDRIIDEISKFIRLSTAEKLIIEDVIDNFSRGERDDSI